LRENLGLFGSKKGCDHGQCGACTLHVNGRRINSCLTFAIMHQDDEITTIEGLAKDGRLNPVQAAFLEHDAFQCGYCTPGQIMSAVAMLNEARGCSASAATPGVGKGSKALDVHEMLVRRRWCVHMCSSLYVR